MRLGERLGLQELLRLGLRICDLDRLAVKHRASGDPTASRWNDKPRRSGDRARVGCAAQEIAVKSEDDSVIGCAEARGALGHRIEHRLDVGR
jgi:hypothetical protein